MNPFSRHRNSNTQQCSSSIRQMNTAKNVNNKGYFTDQENVSNNEYAMYWGKYRKSAVKSNPLLKLCDNSSSTYEDGYGIPECDKAVKSIRSKAWLLEEFRRVYRFLEKNKAVTQSVRTDIAALKQMEKAYVLEPVKTVGRVEGVEIGDTFEFRLELVIMGIHFQQIKGIDYTETCPHRTLLATSVVATEGYEDNMVEKDAIWYTGEGGNFESGCNKGALSKDQVMEHGNLALKNSLKKRTEVRVVRGIKRGQTSKTVYVYDGLYTVVDCREKTGVNGRRQFEFKLVRCPGQKTIEWANYKLLSRNYQ